ncbi:amidohydrolase family protein [Sporolactobacillus terrae]|uniref:S-adenosylhomocysteine deaminase n=1 Tax=Sporolactobacillus terrae TaxID=269673 RepID=A0A410D5I3_9BACL|nr:amidohydrolase family protein [Sporolactobacillus terrae]QAA21341.1 S-adenosylhomocysteine deaminase [Sporolactobacillus terrae]QAA24313.1 S-adenosylhomocysteine deaminase [Sporolactobacillus terrae]UAK16134.1 amidohydrolase family protein [Sporolactobacillus terrae]BBN97558.1 5-methylthioadenosine/S-adenosylhomocysteine deaminase [Sporolactobacillus terrae]
MKLYKPFLLFEEGQFKLNRALVVDDGGEIASVGAYEALVTKYPGAELMDWSDEIIVPGTVNAHNHSFQSLLRGLAADRPFLEWRDQALYKFSPYLKAKDVYTGAVFAFSEMMKCGATTVSDYFYVHNDGIESDEAVIQAAKDVGIRFVLARTMYDWTGAPAGYVESVNEAVKNVKYLAEKYEHDPMVSIVPAPHSLHAASVEMVKAGHRLAQELDCRFHIHVAEEPFEVDQVLRDHRMRPVELLDKIGVMADGRMTAIHCVWLDDHEKQLMAQNQASLVYCPSSNMFLADGITDIPALMNGGVTIGLGSDGACSNNRISVFEEMRMCAMLQKVSKLDSLAVNYHQAFAMGTKGGAEILQQPIGELKPGFRADFVALNQNDLSMQPISDTHEQVLPNIVYAMQPTAVDYVVVNGKCTVDHGNLTMVNEKQVIHKVQNLMNGIDKEASKS